IEAAARRLDRDPAFLDEVRQALRVRLLVAPEGGRPRIADYAGRGPLRAWVGVAALRVALNLKRAAAPAGGDLLAELGTREPDPELRHLKKVYRAEFRGAGGGAGRAARARPGDLASLLRRGDAPGPDRPPVPGPRVHRLALGEAGRGRGRRRG